MSTLTKYLKLFKWNTKTDGSEKFDIDKSMNDNWDKIDKDAEQANTRLTTVEKKAETLEANTEMTDTTEISEEITVENCAGVCGKLDVKSGKSEQETRDGKNKFKEIGTDFISNSATAINNKQEVTLDFSKDIDTYFKIKFDRKTEENYTLSFKCENLSGNVSYYIDGNRNRIFNLKNGLNICKIDAKENPEGTVFDDNARNSTSIVTISDIMILEGEYTEENIPIYEKYGVSPSLDFPSPIRNCGDNINIFNKDGDLINTYIRDDGSIGDANTQYIHDIIDTNIQKNYIMSFKNKNNDAYVRMCYYNNDVFIKREIGNTNNFIFNVPSECTKIDVRTNTEKDKVNNMYFEDLKIEKGVISTPYTPYGCGSISFKLKDNSTNTKTVSFPLEKGQVLHKGDYLAEDGIHQKRKKLIDTENWQEATQYDTENYKVFYIKDLMANAQTPIISSHFKVKTGEYVNFLGKEICCYSGRAANKLGIYVSVEKTLASSLENWNNYLLTQKNKNIPVEFEYNLSEEQIIPYTSAQEQAYYELQHLLLYEGYTNITCIDEIKPDIQLTYYINNELNRTYAKRCDEIEKRVRTLELAGGN